jgi:hypothetical protein
MNMEAASQPPDALETARPVVWEGAGAQSPAPHPIIAGGDTILDGAPAGGGLLGWLGIATQQDI